MSEMTTCSKVCFISLYEKDHFSPHFFCPQLPEPLPHGARTTRAFKGTTALGRVCRKKVWSIIWVITFGGCVIVDSAQTEYCSTFHFPSVSQLVTGVTSQLFSIIWWFGAWKPHIESIWKEYESIQGGHPDHLTTWSPGPPWLDWSPVP